jgi:MFS transporter, DHA2 family, multidrug resistance protein
VSDSATSRISLAGGRASIAARDLDWLLVGLGLATMMQFYTFDSVNLILPDMAGAFGVSRDEASWILISFSSAMFIGTPLASYLARRVGMLPYIVGSILVFVVCSIGASLSTRLGEMLVFRSIEGFAAASLNFWWRGSVYVFLTGSARAAAMMRISGMLYLGTTAGLLISGFLVDHLTWRFVCVVDVVLALAALPLLLRYYPRNLTQPEHGQRVDGLGVALLGLALVALQVMLGRGEVNDWFGSSLIVALALVAIVALVVFALRELDPANAHPLLRLRLLRDRNVMAAVSIGLLTGMILAGSVYMLPEYLREIDARPRSAGQTGQLLCIYAITAACVRPFATSAAARFGQRRVVVFALICLIAAMALFALVLTSNTPMVDFIPPLMLYGVCLAPLLSAVGSGTAARVAGEAQIDAVTIYMTVRQFGTAAGVALVNIVIAQRESLHSGRLFEHLQLGAATAPAWLGAVSQRLFGRLGYSAADAPAASLGMLREAAARQAQTLAFADAFRAMAVVGVLALLLTPLMSPPAKKT